jgi:phage baseplate assembly protein gpV
MAAQRQQQVVCTAHVVDNVDPLGEGRVQIALEAKAGKRRATLWARLATLSAGHERGTWFLPEVGDEVVVAFERGDPSLPIVVGSLWSAGDSPPETGPERVERTTIRTRSGAIIRIEDGAADAPGSITIDDGAGDSVRMSPAGIDIRSSGHVTISAAARVEVRAAIIEVDAGTIVADAAVTRFNGTVHCDTLIATNVVASSYAPGVGNVS